MDQRMSDAEAKKIMDRFFALGREFAQAVTKAERDRLWKEALMVMGVGPGEN